MRKTFLTLALVGLLTLPLFAQRPAGGRGMGPVDGSTLLQNKGVQEELKLTDKQKEAVTEISTKMREAMGKGFKGGDKTDKEAFTKAREESHKALAKVVDELTTEQKTRLKQIEFQVQGPAAFTHEELATALKLTDKQKEEAKEIVEDTQKDAGEILKGVGRGGDKEKREEAMTKVSKLRKEALEKITSKLTDEQKKTYKELTGTPFEYKADFGGRPGGRPTKKNKDV